MQKFVPSAVKENFFSSPANQVEDSCQHRFPPSLFQGQICPVRRPVSKSSGKSTIPDFWTWTADPQSNSDIFVWCPSCLLACPANAARHALTLRFLQNLVSLCSAINQQVCGQLKGTGLEPAGGTDFWPRHLPTTDNCYQFLIDRPFSSAIAVVILQPSSTTCRVSCARGPQVQAAQRRRTGTITLISAQSLLVPRHKNHGAQYSPLRFLTPVASTDRSTMRHQQP